MDFLNHREGGVVFYQVFLLSSLQCTLTRAVETVKEVAGVWRRKKYQGKVVGVTLNSKEETLETFCLDFVQEFGLWTLFFVFLFHLCVGPPDILLRQGPVWRMLHIHDWTHSLRHLRTCRSWPGHRSPHCLKFSKLIFRLRGRLHIELTIVLYWTQNVLAQKNSASCLKIFWRCAFRVPVDAVFCAADPGASCGWRHLWLHRQRLSLLLTQTARVRFLAETCFSSRGGDDIGQVSS